MKPQSIIIPLLALILSNCADMGYTKEGKPRATFVGAKASKFVATEQGFYVEGLDTQTGFKDLMDFGGLVSSAYFGTEVMKALSADSIAVDQETVKAGSEATKAKEATKQLGIKEAASVEKAKIHAETIVPTVVP